MRLLLFSLACFVSTAVVAQETLAGKPSLLGCSPKNWKACILPEPLPTRYKKTCKTVPGDPTWPSEAGWNFLNRTVNGRLIKTVPPGAPCHPTFEGRLSYNEAACAQVRNDSQWQSWHQTRPDTLLMGETYLNHTCSITQEPEEPCTLGTLPVYTVDARTVADIQAAVNWARHHNIRLNVHNTGHDFMGKSIGASSLSVWTHNFKEYKVIKKVNIKGEKYKGSAVKVGSAWTTKNLYTELGKIGKVIVGGECEGVGFSGGYIQGGGHGPLTSHHGMASDNALQFELITPNGNFITADAGQNQEIFWALRGGGAATWGIVTSVTVKTYDDTVYAAAEITFNDTNTPDQGWAGIEAFHAFSTKMMEAQMYVYYSIFGGGGSFAVKPILAPGWTPERLAQFLQPLFDELTALGVSYTKNVVGYSTFMAMYQGEFAEFPQGSVSPSPYLLTSRMITASHIRANNSAIIQFWRDQYTAGLGYGIVGHMFAPGRAPNGVDPSSAINPAWKDSYWLPLELYFVNPYNFTAAQLDAHIAGLTEFDNEQKAITPGSGAYVNEGNIHDPNWNWEFFGTSWPRLARIKDKIDPWGVLYAQGAVGAQNWVKVGPKERLCPV